MRRFAGCLLVLGLVVLGTLAPSASAQRLIPNSQARRFGLEREWFTRVDLDATRSRVAGVFITEDTLFVQTDGGGLQAIDTETGGTLWSRQIGREKHPSFAPAANDRFVAVVNDRPGRRARCRTGADDLPRVRADGERKDRVVRARRRTGPTVDLSLGGAFAGSADHVEGIGGLEH